MPKQNIFSRPIPPIVRQVIGWLLIIGISTFGAINNLPARPHRAALWIALPVLLLLSFLVKYLLRIILTPRQKTALWITSAFFRVGVHFVLSLLLAVGIIAAGVITIIQQALYVGISIALLGVVVLLYQIMRIIIFRRQTKSAMTRTLRKHGFCPHCSYDLRAASARCPECGKIIPSERRAQANIEV